MKKRILLVDDDVTGSCLLRTSLERTGLYAVAMEHNPTRAVETARWLRPHLVLLDVMMEEMDGGAVAQALTAEPNLQHTTVIFMTAIVSAEEAARGPIGGFHYIAKPVSVPALIEFFEQGLCGDTGSAPPRPPLACTDA